jgi:hypothetical protein
MLNPSPNPNVVLPDDYARCAPGQYCPWQEQCARYLAPVPTHGGTIFDGTQDILVHGTGCYRYMDVSMYVRPPPRLRKHKHKPTVHPPIKGIGGRK